MTAPSKGISGTKQFSSLCSTPRSIRSETKVLEEIKMKRSLMLAETFFYSVQRDVFLTVDRVAVVGLL